MNNFEQLLASEEIILLDGAMGTMLMDSGLGSGDPPDEWNLTHPEKVKAVHRRYIQAGSRIILTNSFGANRLRLSLHNLQDQVIEINRAAANLARAEADDAPHLVVVAGSMGPTGELMKPYGTLEIDEALSVFKEQASALIEEGVDVIWIETMSDLGEVKSAIEATRSFSDIPIVATMTFDTNGRTMMGITPEKAIRVLSEYHLSAVGANCGNGPQEIEEVIASMHTATPEAILVAKANAGVPKLVNNNVAYDATPEIMGKYSRSVQQLGARLIGGCCGNTSDHIKSMALSLDLPLSNSNS